MKASIVKKGGDVKVKEKVLESVEVIENVNGAETITTPKKKKPPADTNGLENNIAVGKKKSTSKSPEVTKKKIIGVAGKKQKVQKRKLEKSEEMETKTPGKENTTPIKKKQKTNNATTAKGMKFKLQFQNDKLTKVDGMWMLKTDVEEYTNAKELSADKNNLKQMKRRLTKRLRKELKRAASEEYKVAAKEATVPSQMPLTYQENYFMTQYEDFWVQKTAVSKLEGLAQKKTQQLIMASGKGESTRNLTKVEKMKLVKFMQVQKVRFSKKLKLSLAKQVRKEMKANTSLSFPNLETTSDAEEGEGIVKEKGGVVKEKGKAKGESIVKGKENGEGKKVKGEGKREKKKRQALESLLNIDIASDPNITTFFGHYVNKSAIPALNKLKDKLHDTKLSYPDRRRRLKVAAKQEERTMMSDKMKKKLVASE